MFSHSIQTAKKTWQQSTLNENSVTYASGDREEPAANQSRNSDENNKMCVNSAEERFLGEQLIFTWFIKLRLFNLISPLAWFAYEPNSSERVTTSFSCVCVCVRFVRQITWATEIAYARHLHNEQLKLRRDNSCFRILNIPICVAHHLCLWVTLWTNHNGLSAWYSRF